MDKIARVVVIRHSQYVKVDGKQVLTILGELIAFVMGIICRGLGLNLVSRTNSPQPRAGATDKDFCFALGNVTVEPTTDPRADDFSTDQRPEVKAGMSAAKEYMTMHGVDAEPAIFMAPGCRDALVLKGRELLAVVQERGKQPGDHLLTVHGGAVDFVAVAIREYVNKEIARADQHGMGYIGGQIGLAEGFVVTFDENGPVAIEMIRHPLWLKALIAMASIVNA